MEINKKAWLLISTLVFLVVWTTGVYAYASFRIFHRNTPQTAVQSYLASHHWNFPNASILSSTIPTNGGDFVVVELRPTEYQIFYTWVENGRWQAANTGFAFNPSGESMSEDAGVPADMQQVGQNNWFSAVLNVNQQTKAVLSYAAVGNGTIPFSMVQVAQFNVWACRYPTPISMPAYYKGYDKGGKEIWTTKR